MSTAAKTPNYNLSQVAGSDIPDWITDYTSDMKKIDEALKENADDIATVGPDEFSEESTYAAGDYCIKDNVIYKAKTAVEAGAFDISDWTATTIFDELSGLNQNMFVIGTNWSQNGQLTLTTANVFEKVIEIPDLPAGTYIATVRMQYNDGIASTNVISWVSIIKDNETSSTGPGNAVTIPGGTGYPGASITRIITLESPGAISAWARSSNGSAMFTGMLQVIRIK